MSSIRHWLRTGYTIHGLALSFANSRNVHNPWIDSLEVASTIPPLRVPGPWPLAHGLGELSVTASQCLRVCCGRGNGEAIVAPLSA